MVDALYGHFARRVHVYLWLLVAFVGLSRYFTVCLNVSTSLPGTIFVVAKAAAPDVGDLAAFRYQGDGPYERGALFLKRIAGLPGSIVTVSDAGAGYRDYYVNGTFVGRAKPISKMGMSLVPGPVGIIPDGHYYVAAPHPDSLDSRYALVGWISKEQIVGKAFRIL